MDSHNWPCSLPQNKIQSGNENNQCCLELIGHNADGTLILDY